MMSSPPVYKTWNETVRFTVDRIATPATVRELRDVVSTALNAGLAVKTVGVGHGNTDIITPRGENTVCISLENLKAVRRCTQDEITVEGGMTLRALCDDLMARDLEPLCILEYGFFHVGAICGTHAHDTSSSDDSASFASHVSGVKLLTYQRAGDGSIAVVSREFHEDTHPREMRLLRSHFGLLGIVYEVTLRVRPAQPIAVQYTIQSIEQFLQDPIAAFYDGDEEQRFVVIAPDTRDVFIEKRRRLDARRTSERRTLKGWIFFPGRLRLFFHTEALAARLRPRFLRKWLGYVARKVYALVLPRATRNPITFYPCERGEVYDDLPKFDFVEWAYPADRIRTVLEDLLRLQARHGLVSTMGLYLERRDDDAALSRSFDGDKISIDVVNVSMDETWYRFVEEWNERSLRHGGIPHFNKTPRLLGFLDGPTMHRLYPSARLAEYERFAESLDPEGLWGNRFRDVVCSAPVVADRRASTS